MTNQKQDRQFDPTKTGSVIDRRTGVDRRAGEDETNLERRRGPGRRLTDWVRNAEEGEMTREQQMFLHAIDTFKRVNEVSFPTWTDVLEVVRRLGYRKTMSSELNLGSRIEDWCESSESPSGVDRAQEEEPNRYRKAG
ncbi:MAG: hypothetical protein OSA40_07415 [Phycisphaerales bacterium]|jgi:hypothetical protein|nr:hypothetical protein [Phycisphaerales bacterium]